MTVTRKRLALAIPAILLLLALVPDNASAGPGAPYRRWISPKVLTCSSPGPGVQAAIDNQNVEFNALPADAQYTINYVLNGVTTTTGPLTVEQTSGTRNYAAFSQGAPSYPFTFLFRLDTIINGEVVYTSTLDLSCTADGTRTVVAENVIVEPTTTSSSTTPSSTSSTSSSTSSTVRATTAAAAAVAPRFTG